MVVAYSILHVQQAFLNFFLSVMQNYRVYLNPNTKEESES